VQDGGRSGGLLDMQKNRSLVTQGVFSQTAVSLKLSSNSRFGTGNLTQFRLKNGSSERVMNANFHVSP
jgi:hypothetical protein